MEFFLLYLLTSVGSIAALLKIGGVFFVFALIFLVIGVIVSIIAATEFDNSVEENLIKFKEPFGKPLKTVLILSAISYSLGSMLPTERNMAIIVGGGIAYQAVTSETGKEVGGKAVELLMKKVDELLAEPNKSNPPVSDVKITQESYDGYYSG